MKYDIGTNDEPRSEYEADTWQEALAAHVVNDGRWGDDEESALELVREAHSGWMPDRETYYVKLPDPDYDPATDDGDDGAEPPDDSAKYVRVTLKPIRD